MVSDAVKYITNDRGERTAVVLPISDYEKLLEDLEDLAVVAERRDEPAMAEVKPPAPALAHAS